MGVIGLAIGAGATVSTAFSGLIADRYHTPMAFAALAGVGVVAFLLLWAFLPETRPVDAAVTLEPPPHRATE